MTRADKKMYDRRLAALMQHNPRWSETEARQNLKQWGRGSINRRAKAVHDVLVAEGLL